MKRGRILGAGDDREGSTEQKLEPADAERICEQAHGPELDCGWGQRRIGSDSCQDLSDLGHWARCEPDHLTGFPAFSFNGSQQAAAHRVAKGSGPPWAKGSGLTRRPLGRDC